jgi:hypothetical protein
MDVENLEPSQMMNLAAHIGRTWKVWGQRFAERLDI